MSASALQNRLSQVAREYELEVLRDKMEWMRRLEEAEETARIFKDKSRQQSSLLEEYVNELDTVKAELSSVHSKLASANSEIRSKRSREHEQIGVLQRELVSLRFQLAGEKAERANRVEALSENNSTRYKEGTPKATQGKENREPPSTPLPEDSPKSPLQEPESPAPPPNPENSDLPSPGSFIKLAGTGKLDLLRNVLEPRYDAADSTKYYKEVLGAALIAACAARQLACAELLLSAGADAKTPECGPEGLTALHSAAGAGDTEIVALLLQRSEVGVNALDARNMTPLHYAVAGGHAEVAAKLLREGADPTKEDAEGNTALALAKSFEQQELEASSPERVSQDAELRNPAAQRKASGLLRVLQDKDLQFCNCTVRACAALREGRDQEALDACTAALELAPKCSRAVPAADRAHLHYNRAQAASRLNMRSVAIEACDQALELDPMHCRALALRGECHSALLQYEDAVNDFMRLAEIEPNDPLWYSRAAQAQREGQSSHYELLDIDTGASPDEIKKAFREQCKKWHPDRQKNAAPDDQHRATTHFKRINEAYQTLGDPQKRLGRISRTRELHPRRSEWRVRRRLQLEGFRIPGPAPFTWFHRKVARGFGTAAGSDGFVHSGLYQEGRCRYETLGMGT
eukprot:gene6208-7440_t